jgi:hypothetical protein
MKMVSSQKSLTKICRLLKEVASINKKEFRSSVFEYSALNDSDLASFTFETIFDAALIGSRASCGNGIRQSF